MTEQVSPAVSVLFILTTFAAVGILLQSLKRYGLETAPSRILVFLLPLWLLFQGIVSKGGLYAGGPNGSVLLVLAGILPALAFVLIFVFAFRQTYVGSVSLRFLLLIQTVRIPVAIGLYLLYREGLVSSDVTFIGYNFDILAGVTGLLLFAASRNGGHVSPISLWFLNLVGLVLLFAGVAAAAFTSSAQVGQLQIAQGNVGLYHFPVVWLATVILPIIFFAHVASLTQLLDSKDNS
jgi:hypothetical protein